MLGKWVNIGEYRNLLIIQILLYGRFQCCECWDTGGEKMRLQAILEVENVYQVLFIDGQGDGYDKGD